VDRLLASKLLCHDPVQDCKIEVLIEIILEGVVDGEDLVYTVLVADA
jgi:hypothetical protein